MVLAFETSVGVQSGDFGLMTAGSDMARSRGADCISEAGKDKRVGGGIWLA